MSIKYRSQVTSKYIFATAGSLVSCCKNCIHYFNSFCLFNSYIYTTLPSIYKHSSPYHNKHWRYDIYSHKTKPEYQLRPAFQPINHGHGANNDTFADKPKQLPHYEKIPDQWDALTHTLESILQKPSQPTVANWANDLALSWPKRRHDPCHNNNGDQVTQTAHSMNLIFFLQTQTICKVRSPRNPRTTGYSPIWFGCCCHHDNHLAGTPNTKYWLAAGFQLACGQNRQWNRIGPRCRHNKLHAN